VRLAIGTGARRGELLALRWSDVDFERATLTVRASLSETRAGVVEKSTKTDRVRIIALAATAIEALRRQRVMQAQDRLAAGQAFEDAGYAFKEWLAVRFGHVARPKCSANSLNAPASRQRGCTRCATRPCRGLLQPVSTRAPSRRSRVTRAQR